MEVFIKLAHVFYRQVTRPTLRKIPGCEETSEPIYTLPPEIIDYILQFVDLPTKIRFTATCRRFSGHEPNSFEIHKFRFRKVLDQIKEINYHCVNSDILDIDSSWRDGIQYKTEICNHYNCNLLIHSDKPYNRNESIWCNVLNWFVFHDKDHNVSVYYRRISNGTVEMVNDYENGIAKIYYLECKYCIWLHNEYIQTLMNIRKRDISQKVLILLGGYMTGIGLLFVFRAGNFIMNRIKN